MRKFLLYLTLIVAYQSAVARADVHSIGFDEFVKEALASSLEASKIDATLAERIAEAFSARVKENPLLNASTDNPINPPPGEHREILVTLSQAIRPSDFGERRALANVIEETGSADKILAINEFIQSLRVLYARAWQYQETQILLADSRRRASQILKKITDAANRGLFAEGDVDLFRAEQKTFDADTIAARSELARTKADLIRLSGVNLEGKVLERPEDTLPYTKDALERIARGSKLPLQRRYELLKKLAQKQLEVARLDSFPVVSPELGYGRHDDGTSQVTVGISIPLPFFNRNQAEKIKAQGALSAAERGQTYVSSDAMVAEVRLLFDAFESMKAQVDLYDNGVIPLKRKALEAYYRQFEAGIGNSFQLWQSQRELSSSRLRALELRSALTAASAQIKALIGQQF